jgi:RNA polymerase sigma-70 factor, ECF subfamily
MAGCVIAVTEVMAGGVEDDRRTGIVSATLDVEDTYRRYGPMVLRRCRRLLRDEQLALDAMQDTFIQVLRYRDRLRDEAPSSLLYRIATHVCLNRIRTFQRHPENPGDDLLSRIASLEAPEEASLARNLLSRIFGGEPVSTRTIAVLHHVDGLTLEEVACEVGLSVSGVRKRLRRLQAVLATQEEGASA